MAERCRKAHAVPLGLSLASALRVAEGPDWRIDNSLCGWKFSTGRAIAAANMMLEWRKRLTAWRYDDYIGGTSGRGSCRNELKVLRSLAFGAIQRLCGSIAQLVRASDS